MINYCISVIGLLFSLIAIIVSIVNAKSNNKQKEEEASKLVVRICNNRELSEKEKKMFGESYIPQPVKIKSNSNGEFRDIYVILVESKDSSYINKKKFSKKVKNLEKISIAVKNKYYNYIDALFDEKELLVPSAGRGMCKTMGIVLLFKDSRGNEWFKDVDNRLYTIKNMKNKLADIGLENPGYEHPVCY